MTELVKAPDIRVVKSAAKALRAKASDTVKISHSLALEIAANAFGFTNWHACRSHFKHIEEQVFSVDWDMKGTGSFDDIGTMARQHAIGIDLTFTLGDVTAEAISAIRSPQLTMDILALGATSLPAFDVRLPKEWSHEGSVFLYDDEEVYVAGSMLAARAKMVTLENIFSCFTTGMALAEKAAVGGDAKVKDISERARSALGENCFMVPKAAVTRIGQMAQVEMNLRVLATPKEVLLDRIRSCTCSLQ